ncbi:50S ribosomal protein L29 [Candidatus Pacearchaeota archaeon CG06_land_8_20_14_3_00_35_12]|nr:MAG: 50S ribosomal protein L29 [Candidatus Pacearchaeota archaeon CG06_land_8_20_14_3_00_35_12]
MVILRNKDIKNMSKEELDKKLKELNLELMKMSAQRATHTTPTNPGKIKEIKKTIAKIFTKLNK